MPSLCARRRACGRAGEERWPLMDEATRDQVKQELEALRAQMESGSAADSPQDAALREHVDSLHGLVSAAPQPQAYKAAQLLERRLLAWEAEHPKLVALAARVARALEDSGL
jgi:hypothetical protein